MRLLSDLRPITSKRTTLSDLMRAWLKGALDPIGEFLVRLGLTPNGMTLLGFLGTAIAGIVIARGQLVLGGILVLFTAPLDTLDGAMARARGAPTAFGGFIDSVTDRYTELFLFGGILYHFLVQDDHLGSLLAFAAAGGSLLVSYAKARAEAAGFDAHIGLLSRFERFLILIPSLITQQLVIGLGVIAVLSNVTAIQRILHVSAQARLPTAPKRGGHQ